MIENPVRRPMVPPTRLSWPSNLIFLSLSTSSKEAVSKKMWTSSRDESGRSSPCKRKIPQKYKTKILTEERRTCRPIESNFVDITPLIAQVLLYDSLVLKVFDHFKLGDISIQPLAMDLASKSLLWIAFNALSTLWRTKWPLLNIRLQYLWCLLETWICRSSQGTHWHVSKVDLLLHSS